MRKARIAVLAVAAIAGLLAWRLASSIDAGPPVEAEAPVPQVELAKVLVAARDIQPGETITAADMRWENWPRESANDAFVTEASNADAINDLAGVIARGAFFTGEPIRHAKIVKSGQGGYLSAVLPAGMRAISTKTSPQTGAGGFILPNDRVDVILTRRQEARGNETKDLYTSETVLQNVRVLAIDQTVEEKDGNKVVVGNVATLELGPRQSEVLALAEQLGEISLALRSILDGDEAAEAESGNSHGGTVTIVKYGVSRQVSGTN